MSHRIVVIGGMGPQASLELHQRIIAYAAEAGAVDNQDYPEILHTSIPIPDFISSGDSAAGLTRLKQSLDDLRIRQDDRIVLACNTAHLLVPELEEAYDMRLTSLVQATVQAIKRSGARRVGLLASPTTVKSKLYEKPLSRVGCETILPTLIDIDILEQAIRHVIAGGPAKEFRGSIEQIINRMIDEGADCVILGCTELSVIFSHALENRVVDPLSAVCEQLL